MVDPLPGDPPSSVGTAFRGCSGEDASAAGAGGELVGEDRALARGQRAQLLVLVQRQRDQELAGAGAPPASLAGEELGDGHALGLPRAVTDDLRGGRGPPAPPRASALQEGAAPSWRVRGPACVGAVQEMRSSSLRVPSWQRPL